MDMHISTRKIEIRVNESDKDLKTDFYKKLRDIEYHTYKYANQIVQLNFFKDIVRKGIGNGNTGLTSKEITEKSKELFGCSERNIGYKFIDKKYKDVLPSFIRTSLNSVIYSQYNSDKGDYLKGKRSIRTYKKGLPTPFMKSMIVGLKKDVKDFSFTFYGIPMITRLGRDRSNNSSILENILDDKFKLCDSSFQFKKGKLFLLLVFKSPVEKIKLSKTKVCGVDLGLNVPLYAAISGSLLRIGLGSRESFTSVRTAFQYRRRKLQSDLKISKGGKGRKKKLKALESLKEKEFNFAKTYNHKIAKQLIDFSIKNGCGVINIEKLTGIKDNTNEYVLRNWSYHQLQTFITQKAKKSGIDVNVVEAVYTSQRCNECGHIESGNRIGVKFKCLSCGHEEHSDYNAAKNVSIANTKEFIEEIKEYKKAKKELEKIDNLVF